MINVSVFAPTEATSEEDEDEDEEEATSTQVEPLPSSNPGPSSKSSSTTAADSTSSSNLRPGASTSANSKTSASEAYLKPQSNLGSSRLEHEVQSTPCRTRKSTARVSFQIEAPNLSPILVNQTRKSRKFVGSMPATKRELKVVVSDCRKSLVGLGEFQTSGNSVSATSSGNMAANNSTVNNTTYAEGSNIFQFQNNLQRGSNYRH